MASTVKSNIFVLTCKRDTPDPYEYLKRTIDAIEAQGPNCYCAIVSGDGPYEGPKFSGWDILVHPTKANGNRDAWWTLFEAALSMPADALCFEDDIDICPGGLQRMLNFRVPGDLVGVKFFTPRPIQVSAKPGLHRVPPQAKKSSAALFLQAHKFSRSGLAKIAAFKTHPDYNLTEAGDQALGFACAALDLSIGQHKPDLVEHVGAVSKAQKSNKLAWWRKSSDWSVKVDLHALDGSLYV